MGRGVLTQLFSFIDKGIAPITQYTHVRNNNNSNTQGSFPNAAKVIFNTLKVRIRSLWEKFKRVPILKMDVYVEKQCLIQ